MRNRLKNVTIKNAPDGTLRDGAGLQLVKEGDGGKWIYRYSHLGKRREMGLGKWPIVGLADARQMRDAWEAELAAGRDPIAVRDAQRAAERQARDRQDPTFEQLTLLVFEAKKANLRGEGARGRWLSPFTTHLFAKIGHIRAAELTRHDIAKALKPIWRTKHPTALKAYQRTALVLKEGKFMGYGTDPFEAEAAVRILGEVRHVAKPIPSTPWEEIPALYAKLGDSAAGECLRFMILTCVRADACTGARFEEIDGDIWTVPAARIKGREGMVSDFRVPLSQEALRIVDRMRETQREYLFSPRPGQAISTEALEHRLNRMFEPGRPHGFRTSFRTWVQDTDACSWEVSEMVLGHSIGNKVERTYARSDLLDRRRIVMEAWANYVTSKATNIVSITTAKAGKT